MNILVGDLAKLFGISSQSLHYYEKIGILKPEKDIVNDYRYYNISDFSKLGALRKLRNADFSMYDSLDIFNSKNYNEVIDKYNQKKQELLEDIEKKQKVIEKLNYATHLYEKYNTYGSKIYIEQLPSFLRFESADTHIIFQNKKMKTEAMPWFISILHTFSCQMFYYNDCEKSSFSHFTHGMITDVDTAKYLNLKVTENVMHIDGGNFICCLFESGQDSNVVKSKIQQSLEFAKSNNIKIRGNPCAINIFSYQDKKFFNQILIPIF